MDFFFDDSNIDLRQELHDVLFGRVDLVSQGRPFILRKLTDTVCVCWDGVSGGPKGECPYCQGEGYQFYEYLVTMFMVTGAAPVYKPGFLGNGKYPQDLAGYTDPSKATAFCEYTIFPDYERYRITTHQSHDKLYELKVAPSGKLHHPQVRTGKWKIFNVTPIHGDYGRVEFFELSLEKEVVG